MSRSHIERSLALVLVGLALCHCADQDPSELADDSGVYERRYVSASSLNCRLQPEPAAPIVTQFARNTIVEAGVTQDGWTSVKSSADLCWVVSKFLTLDRTPIAKPTKQTSPKRRRTRQSDPRADPSPKHSDDYCPCSGTKICVGPRGGRFCITSGKNKRDGV